MSVLRKATSDPNLPMPVTEYDNVPIKLVVPPVTKKKDKPTNIGNAGSGSDGGLHANSDRNDFFQDLIKKEAQLKKVSLYPWALWLMIVKEGNNSGGRGNLMMASDSHVNTKEEEPESPPPPVLEVPPPPPSLEAPKIDPEIATRKKSSSFSIEDEERFLRNMGWTPEEEIPELTSEEICAVKNKVEKNKKVIKWPQRAAQTVL